MLTDSVSCSQYHAVVGLYDNMIFRSNTRQVGHITYNTICIVANNKAL